MFDIFSLDSDTKMEIIQLSRMYPTCTCILHKTACFIYTTQVITKENQMFTV